MAKWQFTIYLKDLKRDGILRFEQASEIAQRIRESAWFRHAQRTGYSDLSDYVEELADAQDADHFKAVMDNIWDEANYNHACFIDTVSPVPGAVTA